MNWMLGGLEPLCLRKKSPRLAKGLKGQKIKRTAQLNKKKKRGKVSFQKRSLQQAYLNPRVYSQIVVVVEGKIEGFLILWTRSQLENCLCFNETEILCQRLVKKKSQILEAKIGLQTRSKKKKSWPLTIYDGRGWCQVERTTFLSWGVCMRKVVV